MDSELPKITKQRSSTSKREDPNHEPRSQDISNNDAFDGDSETNQKAQDPKKGEKGRGGIFKEDIFIPEDKFVLHHKKKEYSKYDFIKVKVTLEEHFYVLSRFLVSRMLSLCKIPNLDAVKISKDLKKLLVEENRLELPQSETNKILFDFMRNYGYGDQYIKRYEMLSKFYQKRVPMIVLISGTIGIAKSLIATQLAERMSISNVLQSEIMESVMQNIHPELFKENFKLQEFSSEEELISKYQTRCRIDRRGANADIYKGLNEGKPLIIEGYTVDPSLYIKNIDPEKGLLDEAKLAELENLLKDRSSCNVLKERIIDLNMSNHIKDKFKICTDYPIEGFEESERERKLKKDIDKADQKAAVIVPIMLVLNREDHYFCIESKLENLKVFENLTPEQRIEKINTYLNNYEIIQRFLIKKAPLCTVVPISLANLEHTLEVIQDLIIEKIEAAYQRGDF